MSLCPHPRGRDSHIKRKGVLVVRFRGVVFVLLQLLYFLCLLDNWVCHSIIFPDKLCCFLKKAASIFSWQVKILSSGYCGNLHKSGDKIVFLHAIDVEKRPVVMHPRKWLMFTALWQLCGLGTVKSNIVLNHAFIWSVDGMAFRDSYMSWVDKSQSESKKMMESFADKCRDQKVSVVTSLLRLLVFDVIVK